MLIFFRDLIQIAIDADEPLLPMHIFTGLGRHLPKAMENLGISLDDILNSHVLFTTDIETPNLNPDIPAQFSMFNQNNILDEFAENLNIRAQAGEFDGIVDYDNKCEEIVSILGKAQKPNPILVGKSGVGKSSLVYALARQIVKGEVPDLLANTIIYSLNLSSLVAGTEYRGQFEARLESFINEIKQYDNIVLFIDEIHTLVGAGGVSGTALEASNILKPDLATGKIKCIGATTINEYKAFISKDSALDRRFQRIVVREPSTEEMTSILPTIVQFFGEKHNVVYSQEFLNKLLPLCDKNLVNKVYPDKVIDVIDHCGASKKLAYYNVSAKITEKRNEILGDCLKVPTPEQQEKFFEAVSKIEAKLHIFPEVDEHSLYDYFERQSNPLYSLVKKDGFISLLKQGLVSQPKSIDEFVENVIVNSLGFNSASGVPDSYSFIGHKGTGKSLFCNILKNNLLKFGANVIFLDGGSVLDYDILSPYNNHSNTVVEQVQIHPQSIIIIDNADSMGSAKALIKQILTNGQLSYNGERVDFSNCQIILTETEEPSGCLGFVPDTTINRNALGQKQILLRNLGGDALESIVLDNLNKLQNSLSEHSTAIEIHTEARKELIKMALNAENKGEFIQKFFSDKILPKIAAKICKKSQKIIIKLPDIV